MNGQNTRVEAPRLTDGDGHGWQPAVAKIADLFPSKHLQILALSRGAKFACAALQQWLFLAHFSPPRAVAGAWAIAHTPTTDLSTDIVEKHRKRILRPITIG